MSNETSNFCDGRFYDKLNNEYVDQWQLDDEEDDNVKRELYKTELKKIPVLEIREAIYDILNEYFEDADDVIQNKNREICDLERFLNDWWIKNIPNYVSETNVKAEL